MAIAMIILFPLMCALGVASVISRRGLKKSLEQKRPETYLGLNLGAPGVDRTPRGDLSIAAYILRKSEWPDFDDSELLRVHNRTRVIDLAYYVVFTMLIAASLGFFLL